MILKRGDLIAITVTKEWAEAVAAPRLFHHFTGDDTELAQTFGARLVSITDSEGLWVEKADAAGTRRVRSKILIPWTHIWTVRSDPFSEAERERIGFAKFADDDAN